MTDLMDKNQNSEFTEEEYYFISGFLIEAGSDTTRISISMALAGARAFPEWVERTQKQLDSVCGSQAKRLPEFSDMDSLPLAKAAIKESLRWKPAFSATGLSHALIKDDTFESFTFRAGTAVTFNSWVISHLDYEDPERFLDQDLDTPTKGYPS
ncbi:hypothetical protein COCC4DRAFT_148065 [Bipolaris maydis ATCC 48331]|uniref:Cytochrome P450 n=2 Tax=Cochliobolus heterostrophus TaxID=5016 RepID=M2VC51_COCH5|nr:uncharacterized protein COCC4DRAFT_148065 [Bipolaris maydis ATCC 48331]EMD97562.1 hypothetical protein COCHEDRAFT_1209386 [Bipolaris maydis C5]KAH7557902.1 hypothetical protein BM1_05174 [Bipolaris maydis]ENI01300.1 hypothetical protein COCC4DRAFT_148065 [Bipolaris maydis ATCC 48331]KAJ5046970.1 cytochrome P450 [Bipolaris maydis]KAJ5052678.1 cytochrome P450 [Bipolaris maydis]